MRHETNTCNLSCSCSGNMSQIPLEPLHLILIGLELFKQLTQACAKI